jgi:DNA-binding response OmpR family regulator
MNVLIVDSDKDMVEMLVSLFRTYGHQVHRAYTGKQAQLEWVQHTPDLVILDTALPDMDALSLHRNVSAAHDALVLITDAHEDVQSETRYLESGADAYLRKPFFPRQILAHMRALSRRARAGLKVAPSSVVAVGPLRVDALRNEATIHGKTVRLTPTESKLLHFMAVNADTVCTTEQIATHVWHYEAEGDTMLVKSHIRHLREKLEPLPSQPRYIRTIVGVGYTLVRFRENDGIGTEVCEAQMITANGA